jgi:hypothetical protein
MFAVAQSEPEITPAHIFGVIKLVIFVVMLGLLQTLKKNRLRQRAPRRSTRKSGHYPRAKVALNTRRHSGSKPEGGSA